jgi:hypothetical protein
VARMLAASLGPLAARTCLLAEISMHFAAESQRATPSERMSRSRAKHDENIMT